MANSYTIGNNVRVSASFTDQFGVALDPGTVVAKILNPGGTTTIYTYGGTAVLDSSLVRDSKGNYHVDVNVNRRGHWYYSFYCPSGTDLTAEQSVFMARDSYFD